MSDGVVTTALVIDGVGVRVSLTLVGEADIGLVVLMGASRVIVP